MILIINEIFFEGLFFTKAPAYIIYNK